MGEYKIKITAESVEEFNSINDKINKLPFSVKRLIESARCSIGGDFIYLTLQKQFSKDKKYYLPSDVLSVDIKNKSIGIRTADNIFFEIPFNNIEEIEGIDLNFFKALGD